jgi:hypothetical protein
MSSDVHHGRTRVFRPLEMTQAHVTGPVVAITEHERAQEGPEEQNVGIEARNLRKDR